MSTLTEAIARHKAALRIRFHTLKLRAYMWVLRHLMWRAERLAARDAAYRARPE
jgi:hypothetical protein